MKQLSYYYLCLKVVFKAIACGYFFVANISGLPMITFALCTMLVLAGTVVAARHYKNKTVFNEIGMFFMADAVIAAFNLVLLSRTVMVETGAFEMIVTGSLFDILVGVGIVAVVLTKRTSYANISR